MEFPTSSSRGRTYVTVPWHSRPDPVALPAPVRWLRPEPSAAPHIPGRLGHGHSLPGPWPRRPRPFPPGGSRQSSRIPAVQFTVLLDLGRNVSLIEREEDG